MVILECRINFCRNKRKRNDSNENVQEDLTKIKIEEEDPVIIAKKKLFLDVAKAMICHICARVPRGAIFQKISSNSAVSLVVCQPCLSQAPKHGREYKRNQILEATLSAFDLTCCMYRKDGCDELQSLDDIVKHEENCCYKIVLCPYLHCEDDVRHKFLVDHILKNHNMDMVDKWSEKEDALFVFYVQGINIEDAKESNDRWMFSFTHKNQVFLLMIFADWCDSKNEVTNFQFWAQSFEGKAVSEKFNAKIQIGNAFQGLSIFQGPIKCIDDKKTDVHKSRFGLMAGGETVKKFVNEKGTLEVEVSMIDLNPEDYAFDSDIKSK